MHGQGMLCNKVKVTVKVAMTYVPISDIPRMSRGVA